MPDEPTRGLYHAPGAGLPWTRGDVLATFGAAVAVFLTVGIVAGGGLGGLVAAEVIGLAGVPLAVAAARGVPLRDLGVAPAPTRALVGASLIGSSCWLVTATLTVPWASWLGDRGEAVAPLADALARHPWLAILALSAAPAVCEELSTRGLLTLGLARTGGRVVAVLVSTAAFAALHASLVRALPTALLGAVLAALTLRTGSVLPAIVAHFLNNAVALAVAGGHAGPVAAAIAASPTAAVTVAVATSALGLALALDARARSK